MQEAQRRSMLGSMGLRILQPRFVLEGAKPSLALPAVCEENFPPHSPANTTVDKEIALDVASTTVQSALGVSQALSALFQAKEPERASVGIAAITEVVPREHLKCRYRLVRVGELLMLLDQPSLEWLDADRTKSFFAELYFSLAEKNFEYWLDVQFDWPPVKNFPKSNDKVMLSQSLSAFLQENVHQPACKWVVIWGKNTGKYLFESVPEVGETAFLLDLPVLMVEGYQEYWQSPHKKVLLWQHLQVIKKSMVSHA